MMSALATRSSLTGILRQSSPQAGPDIFKLLEIIFLLFFFILKTSFLFAGRSRNGTYLQRSSQNNVQFLTALESVTESLLCNVISVGAACAMCSDKRTASNCISDCKGMKLLSGRGLLFTIKYLEVEIEENSYGNCKIDTLHDVKN